MITYSATPQGSDEWLRERAGLLTASEFKVAMGKAGVTRSKLMDKIDAAMAGYPPDPSYSNGHMERGHELEVIARVDFSIAHDVEVKEVGLATNSDLPGLGASLDGLIGDSIGWECKAPVPSILRRYHRENRLPPEYRWQVHGQMFVCDLEGVWFYGFAEGCPPFEHWVPRDEKMIAQLKEGTSKFLADLGAIIEATTKKTGGALSAAELYDKL